MLPDISDERFSSSLSNAIDLTDEKLVVTIAGAGSIGTVLGLLLSTQGHSVTLLRKRGEFGTLVIEMVGELQLSVPIEVLDTKKELEKTKKITPNIVIITAQRQQLVDQLNDLDKIIDFTNHPIIVAVQNGLGTAQVICQWMMENNLELPLVQGIIWWSATLQSSNLVLYHSKAITTIGIPQNIACDNTSKKDLQSIYHLFQSILDVKTVDIDREPYVKLILNVVSPVLALVKQPYPTGINDFKVRRIIKTLFDEVISIGQMKGWYEPDSRIQKFLEILESKEILDHYAMYTDLPPHKVSSQISAEKYGGEGSNVKELLTYFVNHGGKYCNKLLNIFLKLKPDYKAISSDELLILLNI
ncbi:MAG: ketopantoate reductase family protein [Candidatus Kariarchaeaceae archaeon]